MEAKDRIIVALDTDTCTEAIALARELQSYVGGCKIGLRLINSPGGGPMLISAVGANRDFGVFYDAKLHDIPDQVAGAIKEIVPFEPRMLTVHCLGGIEMMLAAKITIQNEAMKISNWRPLVLGVTILTSLDYRALRDMGIVPEITDPDILKYDTDVTLVNKLVNNLSKLAQKAGLDGVVCSPYEARSVREIWPEAVIVTPGIRAMHAPADDQMRTATAREAILSDADYLVIGRPIIQAQDPVVAASKFAIEIEQAEKEKKQ